MSGSVTSSSIGSSRVEAARSSLGTWCCGAAMKSEPATAVVAAGEWGATEVAVGAANAGVVGGLSPWDRLGPGGGEDRS
eukprot:5401655-Prymnesium_polylepis.1